MTMHSIRGLRCLAVLLTIFVTCAAPAAAQTLYGTVVGVAEDASGGVVPNVKITLSNPATGVAYEAESDASGQYTIPNVQPGVYDVKATMTGFKTQTRSGLNVTPNTVSRANLRMEVGAISDQITVQAEAATLQTDKADTHTEITSALVRAMPLPGYRNYQSLINLVPGATPAAFQNSVTDTPGRSLRTNINGTNANNNVTRIDGAASVNLWLPHHTGYVMPQEMLETVNVTTSAGDAEQGMAGGASITLVTKSGTNNMHGSAFWFHDNQHLKARNFFSYGAGGTVIKPVGIYNNFGGTIGGPIKKNKLFFFYSYDNTKQRSSAFGIYSVPGAAIRTGNFSGTGTTLYDPATSAAAAGRAMFPGNTIPASRISPQAQKIQAFFPAPNLGGEQANYGIGATPQFNRNYNDVKINYNRASNHSIWGRYGVMNALVGGRGILGDGVGPAPGSDPGLGDTRVQNTSAGHSLTLGSNMVIDGVIGYQRQDQVVQGQDFGKDFSSTLGIPGIGGPDPRQQGFPNISVANYAGFGVPGWMPLTRIEESFTTSHNLRIVKSKHTMAFGFDGVLHRMNHWQPELGGGPRGVFGFNGGLTTNSGTFNNFNSYGDFLLGLANSGSKSIQHVLATAREYQFGFFASDRWQVTRKLTVNAGLRYEYYPLMGRSHGKGIERLDPETNLVYLGGRGNNPRANGFTVSKRLVAPRLGIAYRLDDNTVIRTGYGINFSPLPWSRPLRGMYPLTVNFAYQADPNASALDLRTGLPPTIGPDLSSGVLSLPGVADMRSPYAGEINRGYTQSWNFTLERKLPGQVVTTVGYVGTQSTNLLADRDINSGQVPGLGNAGRPYSARFNRNIATLMWDGYLSSNYHALQTSVRRQAKNLMLQGAYTWSKAINMADDEGWQGTTYNWGPAFSRNRAAAGYDRRHVLQMGWFYDLPFGKGQKWASSGPMAHVIGGWNLGGITAAFTGTPFTPTSPAGTLALPGNTQTPDQVNLNIARLEGIGVGTRFYDVSAFAPVTVAPGTFRFGSMGRNSLRNPGTLKHDVTLSKNFKIGERLSASFRAEAFNFTNSRISNGFASADVTNAAFLSVRSATDERQVRFGLRFQF